ncbi:IS3 family transposase [Pseudomonas sp. C98]|uniref:IS3 family transposase n=1 Tax=Pseudomonas mercuritolerans TaxID=2951809 RepID=A0ABT2Y353_9PSED|nr:IS3 family transposase [Pseudomonas mercuritolerans]MCV2225378.1 IS3 family transposase [Pseudomonas mercuritolerans]
MTRRYFSTDFKRDAACLVLDKDYSVSEACEAMGVGPTALRRWVEQLRAERSGKTPEKSKAMTVDQQRIQELEATIRRIEREKEIFKKGYSSLDVGFPRSVRLVEELSEQYSRSELCGVFGINRSSYYERLKQRTKVDVERDRLKIKAAELHEQSRGSMGARSLAKALCNEKESVGRYMARSLMREIGLKSQQRRRHRYKPSGAEAQYAPNHLERKFNVEAPNQVWCGDVTYIWAGTYWVYLAAVLDLHARRIVGWAISRSPDSALTCRALKMAFESRGRPENLMFHSDQGCHYSSKMFREALSQMRIKQSMSRRGNCWDNAPMERFFGSLKSEWIPKAGYRNEDEASTDVLRYLTHYYNRIRLHSHNGYRTPVAMEALAV